MGQLAEHIQNLVIENSHSESIKPTTDLNNLYKEVNSILERENTQDIESQKKTLELIRKILYYIKEENEFTRDIIKKKLSPDAKISIFPRKTHSNLNQLLKYRNAISHKSDIPIGKSEATRTVFCFMTLLILSVIPRSSAATGTNHMRTATSVEHGSHEMPRSSAAIGSFTWWNNEKKND